MTPTAQTRPLAAALVGASVVGAILVAAAACAAAPTPPQSAPATCPPTPRQEAQDRSDPTSPILGCANVVNLGRMAERPSDMVRGRRIGPADGAREALAVEAYEKGQIKPFTSPNAASAPRPQITGGP